MSGSLIALALGVLLASGSLGAELRNQLQNSSFEQDWLLTEALARRRWGLIPKAEVGYAESDGKIDHWECPTSATVPTGRTGRAVRLGGDSPIKTVSQGVRYAMRAPAAGNPASAAANFSAIDPADAAKIEPRVVVGGAWIKANGVAEGKAWIEIGAGYDRPDKSDRSDSSDRVRIPIPAGTYDWRYIEGRTAAPVKPCNELRLTISCEQGEIWADDAALGEDVGASENLAVNGGFEDCRAGSTGQTSGTDQLWPIGYSQPQSYWYSRFDYYSWTGWGHDGGYGSGIPTRFELIPGYKPRGTAAVDTLIRHSGKASLRMVAYPGDAYCVMGPAIQLDQTQPRPFEIGCWIRADNILNADLAVYDPDKNEYIVVDTDDLPYLEGVGPNGAKAQGTYDWTYFRRLICPKYPVKNIRPLVAVRGFDGRIIEKNLVGTVWFDDLELFDRDRSARSRATRPDRSVGADDESITALDFGDRCWGENELSLVLSTPKKRVKADLALTIVSPTGKMQESKRTVTVAGGKDERVVLPYRIEEPCTAWDKQYSLELAVTIGKKTRTIRTAFGVPSSLLFTRISHTYAFPEEQPVIATNIRVSHKSLDEVGQLKLQITDPDGKVAIEQIVENPGKSLPLLVPDAEKAIPNLNIDRLVTIAPDVSKLAVRPWNQATRDYTVTVSLFDKNGQEMVRAEGGKFGRMQHFPPRDITGKGKLEVNAEHFLLVDGKPVFPVYFGEYGDTFREEEGCNITRDEISQLGINPYNLAPEEKEKYGMTKNFGCGEWDLNGMMNLKPEDVAAAVQRFKADNPGKLVVSGYDMISHPGSRRADVAAYYFPAWDIAGMEASFASYVPNLKVDYFPAMKGKNCAILVGFENYYFVPYDTLRYRAYLSVMRGAAGLGLIPSRMMEGWPETNNYLRGLNAECRSLAPVFASPVTKEPTVVSDPTLFTWEKSFDGKRYLFVVRGEPFLTRGIWEWVDTPYGAGRVKAHTEPADERMTQHLFQNSIPIRVPAGATIKQEVFIEGAKPKMIALQFRSRTSLDNTWEHRAYWGTAEPSRYVREAEYPADHKPPEGWRAWMVVENPAQPLNFAADRGCYYWEVLGGVSCKAADGTQSLRRLGDVPEPGKWVTLEVPAAQVGLENQALDGICFTVDGGKALWYRTELVSPDGTVSVILDGPNSVRAAEPGPATVTFTVPGGKAVQVRTLFENRKPAVEGATFSDTFDQPYRARLYEIGQE